MLTKSGMDYMANDKVLRAFQTSWITFNPKDNFEDTIFTGDVGPDLIMVFMLNKDLVPRRIGYIVKVRLLAILASSKSTMEDIKDYCSITPKHARILHND